MAEAELRKKAQVRTPLSVLSLIRWFQGWALKLKSYIEQDSWGHVIEASEGYEGWASCGQLVCLHSPLLGSLSKEIAKFVQANAVDSHDRVVSAALYLTRRLLID